MNRLKELRKEKKLTQKELADKINVSKITVLRWENGERQIKPDKAEKLADFFGVSIAHLLDYEDNDFKNETDIKVAGCKHLVLDDGDFDRLINSQKLDDEKRNEVLKVALENVANTIKNK